MFVESLTKLAVGQFRESFEVYCKMSEHDIHMRTAKHNERVLCLLESLFPTHTWHLVGMGSNTMGHWSILVPGTRAFARWQDTAFFLR